MGSGEAADAPVSDREEDMSKPSTPPRREAGTPAVRPATAGRERADLPLDSLAKVGASMLERPYVRRGVPMSDRTISVLLADDHTLVRAGLRALLRGTAPDVQIVGEASRGDETVALAGRLHPDVVVLDLDMPGGDGLWATAELLALKPAPRVLIVTMHTEESRLLDVLQAGASGFLMKDAAERELVDAIRVVTSGEVYVRPRVARFLATSIRAHTPAAGNDERLAALSDRERTVVELIAQGYNGPEIGERLGISAKTVETYKQRIAEKLGIEHRAEYVRLALEVGLLHI